jgi:hypothetical protein
MKEDHGKNKGKKGKRMKALRDEMDDNDRKQVKPRPEPLVDSQDERWAYSPDDPRQTIPTPRTPEES